MSGFDNGGHEPPNFNQPPMAPPPPTVQMPAVTQSSGRGDQSKNKGWIIAISLMAALVLLGGGVLLGIAFLGDGSSNSASNLSGSQNNGDSSNGSAGVATDSTDTSRPPATNDSTAPPTSGTTSTSSTSTAPTPTAAPAPTSTYDWDGVKFEFGSIEAVERVGTDIVISFDRYSLYLDGDWRDATYFTSEQILVANTDWPGQNSNPKLRRYAVMPDANLITVTGLHEGTVCDGTGPPGWTPTWVPFTMDQLLAMDATTVRGHQTSLTFDAAGRVIQIRHSEGC